MGLTSALKKKDQKQRVQRLVIFHPAATYEKIPESVYTVHFSISILINAYVVTWFSPLFVQSKK